MQSIIRFAGRHAFLSNFYPSEVAIPVGTGLVACPTVEHGYQACKTLDDNLKIAIITAASPRDAKRLGRQLPLRDDWETVKITIMRFLLMQKFVVQPLRSMLLATGDAHLEEGNTWGDRFWGTVDGDGENRLGKLLMETRSLLGEPHAE